MASRLRMLPDDAENHALVLHTLPCRANRASPAAYIVVLYMSRTGGMARERQSAAALYTFTATRGRPPPPPFYAFCLLRVTF